MAVNWDSMQISEEEQRRSILESILQYKRDARTQEELAEANEMLRQHHFEEYIDDTDDAPVVTVNVDKDRDDDEKGARLALEVILEPEPEQSQEQDFGLSL